MNDQTSCCTFTELHDFFENMELHHRSEINLSGNTFDPKKECQLPLVERCYDSSYFFLK